MEWDKLILVGATTIGSLIAIIIKELFLTRSFERWKERQTAKSIYRKYRDPIILAGKELTYRLGSINQKWPRPFLRLEVLNSDPIAVEANSINDPYFQRYQLVSTIYRYCAFLGWLELYRQDITFLESTYGEYYLGIDRSIDKLIEDLADGRLNKDGVWSWNDRVLFREEQRAIGETMIVGGSTRTVRGYSNFVDLLDNKINGNKWINLATALFVNVDEQDFRRVRFKRLELHVIDLMILLDQRRVPDDLKQRQKELQDELQNKGGWGGGVGGVVA